MEKDKNIKVLIRVKPSENSIKKINIVTQKKISIQKGNQTEQYQFDHIVNENATQHNIYNLVGQPSIEKALQGYNVTLFAYGQTGSGKTYTMQGTGQNQGLIPLIIKQLYNQILMLKDSKFKCSLQFIEIYNEQIFDLFSGSLCSLRENKDKVFVSGCREELIETEEEALKLFKKGIQNRHVSATKYNRESSRSHSILTLKIESRTKVNDLIIFNQSNLNLIDLAGSERQNNSSFNELRIQESKNINKSLLYLGEVINKIIEKKDHIPFRNSALTFLLKDSLIGNCFLFVLGMISHENPLESSNTLQFCQRANLIQHTVFQNKRVEVQSNTVNDYISKLKNQILALGGFPLPSPVSLTVDKFDSKLEDLLLKKDLFIKDLEKIILIKDKQLGELEAQNPNVNNLLFSYKEEIKMLNNQLKSIESSKFQLDNGQIFTPKAKRKFSSLSRSLTSSPAINKKSNQLDMEAIKKQLREERELNTKLNKELELLKSDYGLNPNSVYSLMKIKNNLSNLNSNLILDDNPLQEENVEEFQEKIEYNISLMEKQLHEFIKQFQEQSCQLNSIFEDPLIHSLSLKRESFLPDLKQSFIKFEKNKAELETRLQAQMSELENIKELKTLNEQHLSEIQRLKGLVASLPTPQQLEELKSEIDVVSQYNLQLQGENKKLILDQEQLEQSIKRYILKINKLDLIKKIVI